MKIVFEDLFKESKGKSFIYKDREVKMSDEINLSSHKVNLRLTFVSTDSEWKQGIVIQTKGEFEVNSQRISSKVVFWEDTAPAEFEIIIESKDKMLFIYNVWDTGDGTMHYGHNGGALYVQHTKDGTFYYCNDGHPNTDFKDLVFKIELLPMVS